MTKKKRNKNAVQDPVSIKAVPKGPARLSCEIALGPLAIKTEASLDQVSELILRLIRGYREVPAVTQRKS